MECMRENSRIEMTLTSYEKDGLSYEKCYHQGIQSRHMLTLQSHHVQSVGTDCSCTCAATPSPFSPLDLKCDLSRNMLVTG